MKIPYIISALIIIIISCTGREPKIEYNVPMDTAHVADDRLTDTTKVIVAQLPVMFDSTNVLIFPVGQVSISKGDTYSKLSSRSGRTVTDFTYASESNSLSGIFINLIFETSDGQRKVLTRHKMLINRVTYLDRTYLTTRNQYILYTVYDRDTNGDGELNYNDVESLYISHADGSHFKKLTKELHELVDLKFIQAGRMLYFRTLEDIDHNGTMDNNDKFHYYYIDLASVENKVIEYNPLDVLLQ